MMVTAKIEYFEVKKTLVDNGCSDDILLLNTFLKMGLELNTLMSYTKTITKFVGNGVIIMGMISVTSSLDARPKVIMKMICFSVIDLFSVYNQY